MKNTHTLTLFLFMLIASGVCHAQQVQADLKKALKEATTDTAKVNVYNKLADQFKNSAPDSVAFYANKAASLSTSIKYTLGSANAALNTGNFNILTGNYDAALASFKSAQHKFESLLKTQPADKALKNGTARAFASEGIVYTQQSNYYMALENYQKALKIYEEIGQKTNISKALNNIGIVYKSQSNYPKALEYLKKALKIQEAIGEENAAITLTNIGVIYFETGKNSDALHNYNRAATLFVHIKNPVGLALLDNYLGDYYKKQNDTANALDYYKQSLKLYESVQNKFGASLALYNIGKLYFDLNNYTESMVYAQQSLVYAKAIGVLDQTYHSEKLVSDLYAVQNNPDASFAHYKNYIVARDSINNQENNKKFAKAEMNFEYQKKEALLAEQNKRQKQFIIFAALGTLLLIILVLVIYNRMQVKRRLTLQKEVAEYEQKALHLQMNPHFVFNCLGAISSFIVQNGTDSALKYLSKFSKLMRLTLEYSKGSLIPIDKEIESLQNYLELEQLRFNNKFEFHIESSPKIEFNMGLPPLLIQPFVENAILHGVVPKEGNGRIDVDFDVKNGQLICTVSDNGIGLTESKQLKVDSVTAHKSMAMEITKKRLEIMESVTLKSAQIEIEELKDNQQSGTRVTLRLPVQYIP